MRFEVSTTGDDVVVVLKIVYAYRSI